MSKSLVVHILARLKVEEEALVCMRKKTEDSSGLRPQPEASREELEEEEALHSSRQNLQHRPQQARELLLPT
jgi:hypothetical protein